MKIRRKILWIVTPIVLAPLVLLWAAFYLTLNPVLRQTDAIRHDIKDLEILTNEARAEARARFESATREAYAFGLANIAANIDGQLDAIEKTLVLSAHRPDLVELLSEEGRAARLDEATQYFQDLARAHDLATVTLADTSGRVLARVRRQRVQPDAAPGPSHSLVVETIDRGDAAPAGQWYPARTASSVRTSWSVYRMPGQAAGEGVAVISGSVAVRPEEGASPLGYLQLSLPVDQLAREIRGPEELTSSVRLLARDGTVYWSEASDPAAMADESQALYISQVIRGGILSAEVRLPWDVVFENLEPFAALSDTVAAKLEQVVQDNRQVKATVAQTERLVFGTKLALAAVALLLLFLLLGRVASRIELLSRVTRRIRDGELETPLPEFRAEDEVSVLRESIDDMRERLKAHIEMLDRKVAERTLELDTVNKRLEKEVVERRRAEEAALSASTAKSDFLATMSHEIRTPLSGIFGGIHLLLKSDLDEDQRMLGEVIRSSTATLKSLVDDILDFSKIEAGKMVLESAPFDLSKTLAEVRDGFRISAQEKGLEFQFQDRLDDSVLRLGDANRLKQIVCNLLSNAIKFTRRGAVGLTARPGPGGEEAVCIDVVDTGVGMSEDQASRVFESFTQADSSIAREFGGTGLGLAISTRLAQQMGGALEVESRPGEGSRFTLAVPLPFATGLEGDAANAARELGGAGGKRCHGRILYADDNRSNRVVVRRMLEQAGFSVEEVSDGKACVEAAKSGSFDLVLMDCSMPVMDGCAAARSIREWEKRRQRRRLPIVGLTANATSRQLQECLDCGMDEALFKPVPARRLVETCAAHVGRSEA